MTRLGKALAVLALALAFVPVAASMQSADATLQAATAYVSTFEKAFALLVSEESYVQEIRRLSGGGGNLSRSNPGGGIQSGATVRQQILKSDYMLVQLGTGAGWMPFRDTFELNGSKLRDREDRLVKLFLSGDADRFDQAARVMAESTRHNIGNVTRTINIPTLALMFLHASVKDRFTFTMAGEETMGGRVVQRVRYRESARPTLIKTTRGADLDARGHTVDRAVERRRRQDHDDRGRSGGARHHHRDVPAGREPGDLGARADGGVRQGLVQRRRDRGDRVVFQGAALPGEHGREDRQAAG